MKTQQPADPKALVEEARRLASRGDVTRSRECFLRAIETYGQQSLVAKALATAKVACSALPHDPRLYGELLALLEMADQPAELEALWQQSRALLHADISPLFKHLTAYETATVLKTAEHLMFKRHTVLFHQGDSGQDMFHVLSGKFEIRHGHQTVATMLPGELFGELGFFHHAKRSATVRAAEPGALLRLKAEDFRPLVADIPLLRIALEDLYSERILKKLAEETRNAVLLDLDRDELHNRRFSQGASIDFSSSCNMGIIKHGVVEIDDQGSGLKKKTFLGPGGIFRPGQGSAKANTDVEIIEAHIDFFAR